MALTGSLDGFLTGDISDVGEIDRIWKLLEDEIVDLRKTKASMESSLSHLQTRHKASVSRLQALSEKALAAYAKHSQKLKANRNTTAKHNNDTSPTDIKSRRVSCKKAAEKFLEIVQSLETSAISPSNDQTSRARAAVIRSVFYAGVEGALSALEEKKKASGSDDWDFEYYSKWVKDIQTLALKAFEKGVEDAASELGWPLANDKKPSRLTERMDKVTELSASLESLTLLHLLTNSFTPPPPLPLPLPSPPPSSSLDPSSLAISSISCRLERRVG
ncbi:hypothetical protein AAMO2058_001232300 [Amorphochlora amoebiformis]